MCINSIHRISQFLLNNSLVSLSIRFFASGMVWTQKTGMSSSTRSWALATIPVKINCFLVYRNRVSRVSIIKLTQQIWPPRSRTSSTLLLDEFWRLWFCWERLTCLEAWAAISKFQPKSGLDKFCLGGEDLFGMIWVGDWQFISSTWIISFRPGVGFVRLTTWVSILLGLIWIGVITLFCRSIWSSWDATKLCFTAWMEFCLFLTASLFVMLLCWFDLPSSGFINGFKKKKNYYDSNTVFRQDLPIYHLLVNLVSWCIVEKGK